MKRVECAMVRSKVIGELRSNVEMCSGVQHGHEIAVSEALDPSRIVVTVKVLLRGKPVDSILASHLSDDVMRLEATVEDQMDRVGAGVLSRPLRLIWVLEFLDVDSASIGRLLRAAQSRKGQALE